MQKSRFWDIHRLSRQTNEGMNGLTNRQMEITMDPIGYTRVQNYLHFKIKENSYVFFYTSLSKKYNNFTLERGIVQLYYYQLFDKTDTLRDRLKCPLL